MNDGDILKPIDGFPGYHVTEDGRVISKINSEEKELCQWIDNVGYKQVIIRKDKKRCHKRVHILIANAFVEGRTKDKCMVNHIDGNKLNNNANNLEWVTNRANTQHAYDNKLYKSTYRCGIKVTHKVTGKEFEFVSIRSCAKTLGLNRKTITSILKNEKITNNYDYYFEYLKEVM